MKFRLVSIEQDADFVNQKNLVYELIDSAPITGKLSLSVLGDPKDQIGDEITLAYVHADDPAETEQPAEKPVDVAEESSDTAVTEDSSIATT